MKNILTIFMIVLFSQFSNAQQEYANLWKEVAALEKQGLTKSALEKVSEIHAIAKRDRNNPQIIKAFLHKGKYQLILEEDAQLTIIKDLKTEISTQSFPTKNILESILGSFYWQYFSSNRYQFYNRTKTAEKVDATDFRTWDLNTLFKEIFIHFDASLANAAQLQKLDLSAFNAILTQEEGSKIYRPTVYDFLAHNALKFYKSDENAITKPSYKFEIDELEYLCDAALFAEMKLTTQDSLSLEFKALKTYQELIRFHLKDKSPEALIKVNIERLYFVQQKATFEDETEKLIEAFQNEKTTYQSHPYSGMYDAESAVLHQRLGAKYADDRTEKYQWEYKKALELCEGVISKFPKSIPGEKCTVIKNGILQPNIEIKTEKVIPIAQASKVFVAYKNISRMYFTARKLSYKQYQKLLTIYDEDERFLFLQNATITHQWNSDLPTENDYQMHSTEVAMPPLSNGFHIITASPTEKLQKKFYSFGTLQVTDIAIKDKKTLSNHIFQITDRNNGAPIPNQDIIFDYTIGYENIKGAKALTTDATGSVVFESPKNSRIRNIKIKISKENDVAHFNGSTIYSRDYIEDSDPVKTLFFFTDRSIYRPSQVVHFKGILIEREGKKSTIVANEKVDVTFRDANYQEIKTATLTTNEYGSIKGEFIIPNNGLTGSFSIMAKSSKRNLGSVNFSVEEYKRPKFEAEFLPITETFAVNDSVVAKGTAKAFAGSNISDAKVTYSVKRTPRYPVWAYWRSPYISSASQQITSGETTTDASGNFEITFKAIPDASADKKLLPVFDYEITADITDINGETRSASTIVHVGYHSLKANIVVANKLDATKKDHTLEIITKNLNGEKIGATGTITIHKLQAPDRVLRKRPFKVPDYVSIPESEFKKLFPHEAFSKEEQDFKTWKKGKNVFSESFNTGNATKLELGKIKRWESGKYVIELTAIDANGIEIKDIVFTDVRNPTDKITADNKLLEVSIDKDAYLPNEEVVLTLNSAVKNITVSVDIEKGQRIINSYMISMEDGKKTIRIPVDKKDEGGFKIHCSATVFNSLIVKQIPVLVKYPPSELTIETTTFRDKLTPGQDETWSFRIKGPKGEKVAAEVLSSMYDASLDEFRAHQWQFSPLHTPRYYSSIHISGEKSFGITRFVDYQVVDKKYYKTQSFDRLNLFGLYFGNQGRMRSAMKYKRANNDAASQKMMAVIEMSDDVETEAMSLSANSEVGYLNYDGLGDDKTPDNALNTKDADETIETVVPRKNLQETAFFFPQLQTDKDGNVSFNFTTPEALTKWKVQLLAHTKTLNSATKMLTTVTQKELMVLPNAPRFLREGDKIVISSKISNLSEKNLTGEASLLLVDPITGNDLNNVLFDSTSGPKQSFSVNADGNTQVSWTLEIPQNIQAVQYTIIAKAGEYSDGEQNALPVLSNRMLVTETLPMWIRSNETKTFTLDKLATTNSSTLQHHKLSLEVTSNPAWYAVQALPYLMEYPYECSEQTFSRYYANALASHIANSNPRIQEVFNQWKSSDALLSNLEKNQELKSLIIQETPWVRDAQSETEQKKRIALLFDLNRMKNEETRTLQQLKQMQLPSGAFPWFSGGRKNRFITQHIVTGFGHLRKLGIEPKGSPESVQLIKKAIAYLDQEFVTEYKNLRKYNKKVDLSKDHLSYSQLHYLYMRSFFPELKKSTEVATIMDYYKGQIDKYWLKRSLYSKGLMALVSHRMDNPKTATSILRSLKENSITSDELGMYWKANTSSWYWYQAPIETQSLLIEAFSEISKDVTTVDNLKIWLLKHKQTNRWSTTKETSDAVYALLLQGSDWLSVTDMVDVTVGGKAITPADLEAVKVEAGTGYFKTSWNGNEVKPEMANVTLTKKGTGIAWGGLYWQYFEDLDKITTAETSLKLNKKLFKRTYNDTGEIITAIDENTKLEVGDLIRIRIELRNDRPMEFVHMKDMRAAGLESINVLSSYKWQDGLGYYESTKDASTNFFFDYLPKGIFVFEYDLRVNNKGNFSNGITTIQSMYAPEFSSHSKGVRITVD
ncbi:alpha-2-macroglobulin [Kordia sp. YSTF-M3]|uniref:Alpha-2-macroglobulin n=1 Tax=Kordia aestuariivivens TaxID=2759037 RepID=A0ABR7QB05_9FLAO|nr:alpha-2-macroglobulin family protein [Kordia aestuariivivens]MBC8755756.1 alpha-2-macroglobulin [Kordia aestuariivivens]